MLCRYGDISDAIPICNFYNIRESMKMKHLFSYVFLLLFALIGQYSAVVMSNNMKVVYIEIRKA